MGACEIIEVSEFKSRKLKIGNVSKAEKSAKKKDSSEKPKQRKEVFAFESPADMKAVNDWLFDNRKYLHYLLFNMEFLLGRRVDDIMNTKWNLIYNPNGTYKDYWDAEEGKTGKLGISRITKALEYVIERYCKATGCDPAENNYSNKVSLQYTGNYRGKCITYEGYRKQLKKAQKACGIRYNIGSHSMRKSLGKYSIENHPDDPLAKSIMQDIFGHSSESVTNRYIGLTQKKNDGYFFDISNFYFDAVVDGKEYTAPNQQYIASYRVSDIRSIIAMAYEEGIKNASIMEPNVHIDNVNSILELLDESKVGTRG